MNIRRVIFTYFNNYMERLQVEGESDQLEGESFQPAYTPYAAPPQAYDAGYAPVEQRGIEAAVAAGAAGYNGVGSFLK